MPSALPYSQGTFLSLRPCPTSVRSLRESSGPKSALQEPQPSPEAKPSVTQIFSKLRIFPLEGASKVISTPQLKLKVFLTGTLSFTPSLVLQRFSLTSPRWPKSSSDRNRLSSGTRFPWSAPAEKLSCVGPPGRLPRLFLHMFYFYPKDVENRVCPLSLTQPWGDSAIL